MKSEKAIFPCNLFFLFVFYFHWNFYFYLMYNFCSISMLLYRNELICVDFGCSFLNFFWSIYGYLHWNQEIVLHTVMCLSTFAQFSSLDLLFFVSSFFLVNFQITTVLIRMISTLEYWKNWESIHRCMRQR